MSTILNPELADFSDFINAIDDPDHREKFITVLNWVKSTFPNLTPRFAWNQPMFTDHGTFIVGFSVAKPHFNVALEFLTLEHFREMITTQGDHTTKMFWQIKFTQPVNYDLLERTIQYNLTTKADITSFWRQKEK
ncbi:iron chaperone [Lactiplantibacillus mudanjiangensis]|uniref:YdhG-like domain-containing protein n=1 Tax=Lactiplantibacillus mudanjiangensis TaxID=1296538 RepID=A0A660E0V3_9LACO|nr:DUF1801 domain-containing protein [Lactiplantibacillus mudanjiangensis]VDG23399.1 hypothetical protein [Lactobacillus sp. CBA3606] [Lactiplantibacillus mudanjiangensis]VDG29309.1 hypothetical protein [Lactobacillus sp. CBA3606] [Lactiplantibacillus mudanjiangensis]VDG31017.1 hypothetical protein [Lactobacillus sp. CBA3606] [Lactiplantibacillus mudanjiangensis]